ncbi:MAG TPA: L-aspartate oxidase [Gemmatimonadales bacterium]|nr:L-aspartate oxidase [Gemmatimonadales bacterium]
MSNHSESRVVIVGTGLAGLWTAWRLATLGRKSLVLTKGTLAESASAWAQGGIAAAVGEDDSPALHAADTIAAAGGLADPDAVRVLTTEGPARIRELAALGIPFDREPGGALRLGLEGAHSRARVVHAGGDRTGAAVVAGLAERLRHDAHVEVWECAEAHSLLTAEGGVAGVAVLGPRDCWQRLTTGAVVLATGGLGQLFAVTTNPLVATGDGIALAYRARAELHDLDLLQFHPTALKQAGVNPAPLISEAVRGAGAVLVDRTGQRFAAASDPRAELAPRDVLARAVAAAEAEGGAWLDARQVPAFRERFPGVSALLERYHLDATRDLIPVAPALHYAMGGVATDLEGRTSRPGLWAVGEVASTGVHGANRLASNSLLEVLVFADRAARALAAMAQVEPPALPEVPRPETRLDPAEDVIRAQLRRVMTAQVGLGRTAASLLEAKRALARLASATPSGAWRTANQLLVARLIARAALRRVRSAA